MTQASNPTVSYHFNSRLVGRQISSFSRVFPNSQHGLKLEGNGPSNNQTCALFLRGIVPSWFEPWPMGTSPEQQHPGLGPGAQE